MVIILYYTVFRYILKELIVKEKLWYGWLTVNLATQVSKSQPIT